MTAIDRLTGWLIEEVPRVLPGYLRGQRWFAAKSATIRDAAVDDVVWAADSAEPVALLLVTLRYDAAAADAARADRYALLIGIVHDLDGAAALAELPWRAGHYLVEVSTRGGAVIDLLRGTTGPAGCGGVRGGTLEFTDSTGALERTLAGRLAGTDAVALGHEQSNTSIRLQRSHVVKFFRRIQDGENPQLEMSRFLSGREQFRAAPRLDGALTYQGPDGRRGTVAVVEEWIENEGDGWSYVLGQLSEAARTDAALNQLARELFELGTTSADLHVALASDAATEVFAPEVVTPGDVAAWSESLGATASRVIARVTRHVPGWDGVVGALGRRLLEARERLFDRLRLPPLPPGELIHRIRVHGDYHLGQTLRVEHGFLVIDFEGEPLRPLSERRAKQCALKDVAGMLRSFEYAVETVRRAGPSAPALDLERLRHAYLEGYWGRIVVSPAALVPAPPLRDVWTRAFELEKALYEIEYELDNRPAWLAIPLGGALRLAGAEP